MSATLKNIYGAIPATTRGKSIHVGGDPKGNNWLYTTGSAVFIRNLKEPLKSEMYTEHSHQTTVARYAPSGFYIASGDITGTVRIWDTTQKEHILKIELKVIGGPILDLQWSDDSKRIVAVGEGRDKFGSVFLFDSGSSVGEITGHTKPITTCDFKQVRPYRVATGSEDFSVAWLEGPPFKFKKALKEQTRFVNCVRFSPDGNFLVSVGSDKTGHIYDGKTGDYIKAFSTASAHTAGIYSASWSPDSKQILTASADKTCKIWDAASGDCVKTFTFGANPPVELQMLGCLWQGDTLISIALSGEVYYLDVNKPDTPLRVLRGHNKFITALAFDKENNKMYSASYDSSIIQWDVQTGATENFTGKGHGNQVNSLAVQGGNLVSVGMDDSIRLTPTLPRAYKDDAVKVENNPVAVAVGKKDPSLVFAVATDAILVLKNGKLVNKFAVKYQPGSIAISVDETQLSVGGKDNALYQYSISGTDLKETKVLKNHRGPVTALSYSRDGQYLASADANREIFVWTKSGEVKIQGWVFHSAKINSLDWSPDSLHLVSGGLDGNLYVWSIEKTDKRIFVKDAHRGGVNAVLFLDDNTIASAGQDCAIKSWTLAYH